MDQLQLRIQDNSNHKQ